MTEETRGSEELQEEELALESDEIIGKAFRWSLLVLVSVAAVVALIVWAISPREAPVIVEEAPTSLPRFQERPVEPPELPFRDITEEAGITFVHENGARGRKLLPETMGGGCAFLDYDGDGDQDLLFVNSTTWPGDAPDPARSRTLALYRNDGSGRFEDVTSDAGLAVAFFGMGVAIGDVDGDGLSDLFFTAVGRNRLFRNLGGKFEDVTDAAGVAGGDGVWSTSAAFADFDRDGDLDLFVCNYIAWSREIDEKVNYRLTGIGRAYGPPTDFDGDQSYFYRNLGDGRFREEAEAAGLHIQNTGTNTPLGKALGVIPFDFDRDGNLDIFVANDTVANFLFRNLGDGTFREIAHEAGVAFDEAGRSTGAMGIDVCHYRNDTIIGIGIGNFATEMSSLYVADGPNLRFFDEARTEGIGAASRQMLTFGLFFFDVDLDGWPDLFQTNGHLEEEIDKVQPSQSYEQPSQIFWNSGPEHHAAFVPVAEERTGDLARPVVGRGAAYADIDADGDLDLVITQVGRRPLLLRNDQALGHGWIRIQLVGKAGRREAIGAMVEVDAGAVTQRQHVLPARSYLSHVERVLTFGLGKEKVANEIRVYWDGATSTPQVLRDVASGTVLTITEEE